MRSVGRSVEEAKTSQGHGEAHSCLSPLSSPFQLHGNGSAVNPDGKEQDRYPEMGKEVPSGEQAVRGIFKT